MQQNWSERGELLRLGHREVQVNHLCKSCKKYVKGDLACRLEAIAIRLEALASRWLHRY